MGKDIYGESKRKRERERERERKEKEREVLFKKEGRRMGRWERESTLLT